jgi:ribose transport system permease protein
MSTAPRDTRAVTSAAAGTGAAATAGPEGAPSLLPRVGRLLKRQAWVTGAWVLLGLLLILGVATHPTGFSSFDVQTLVLNSMPLAFAAMAQAVVVISGGIDLSVGAAMSVFNVASAKLMETASFREAILLSFALMAGGLVLGALNGILVVLSKVPDIVVTLATSFVLSGVALLILETPGGGAPLDYGNLVLGSVGTDWIPEGLLVLAGALLVFWLPLRLSRTGLAIYAVGSSRTAAFLSGVRVGWTRIAAYAMAGLFASLGGLALTATSSNGSPIAGNIYTLQSFAAIVLGGVLLAGGRGGLVGPVVAAFVLSEITAQLSYWEVEPNWAQVIQGAVVVVVVLIGGLALLLRGRRQ